MNAFNNKTVLITGGTDGIGKELVLQFLQLGAKVITCGRSQQKILALESESPVGNLSVINADVSNEKDCERMVDHAITQFGSIDILINNAGISMRGLLEESGPALIPVIKKVMDINFNGSLYITSYALKYLIQSKGTIVGISSIAGYRGLPGRSGYSASKTINHLHYFYLEQMLEGEWNEEMSVQDIFERLNEDLPKFINGIKKLPDDYDYLWDK
jgi:NAD(P)-dependent dehydrogenase (short-subunit alcohol dehydrogenase family)